jgi:hypothetical protein
MCYFTFGFVRRSEDAVRALVNMDYVASDELGNFVRLGFVLDVQFTYAVRRRGQFDILPYF